MKFLKRTLIVLFSIVALLLIVAFFVDKDYHVSRSIVINQPKSEVFPYIKQLKNQDHFSVWAQMDPNMKKTYKGTDGTVGFVSAWNSKNKDVGAGEQEITGILEGKRIDFQLRFKRPFESVAGAYMEATPVGKNATMVEWGIDGSTPWPFNLFTAMMDMDKMLGKDLDSGLKNLKKELENE